MKKPIQMGIVNLTPDSFFGPSRAMEPEKAMERIREMLSAGVGIIDLGAVSTRPGAADVTTDEEWRRLDGVLSLIQDCPEPARPRISVDTTRAEIVRRVYGKIGPFIVNDISAGEDDPDMLETVASLGLGYIAMHKRGNPRSMDALTDYPRGVVQAVLDYFDSFAARAALMGIGDWILDPGFGFAKTAEQNWELLNRLPDFRRFGRPILVGVADKRFTHSKNPATGHGGSRYAERLAAKLGADILRVHRPL